MNSLQKSVLLTLLFLTIRNIGNTTNIPKIFAIKIGVSHSLTQLGLSPASELRRWYDRGILSPYIYVEYAQPIGKNELLLGLQIIQKGFKTNLKSPSSLTFEYEESYEYLLNYIELPISYKFNFNSYSITTGGYISYLYDDTYSYNNTSLVKSTPYDYDMSFHSSQFDYPERYQSWDGGISLGISKKITPDLTVDFTYQKGLVKVENWVSVDLAYNISFLLGLKYKFLSTK